MAQYAAIGFIEFLGGSVVCVSYWDREDRTSYTVTKEDGIDPHFLMIYHRSVWFDRQKQSESRWLRD